jgi:flagellar motility protein MotE (MotC chaperone)
LSPAGVALGVIIALSWTMVFVPQVSAEQGQDPQRSSTGLPVSPAVEGGLPGSVSADPIKKSGSESSTPAAEPVQGPALTVPEEMVAMFQQRKQDLEQRENAVRVAEAQLAILKAEVGQILSKVEAVEQRRLGQEKGGVGQQASAGKQASDIRAQQLGQLVKMYESMPAEEAAERIERMTNRKALEILRLLKSKSAGAILAQVKVDRAAKLSEEFLTTP